MPALAFLLQNVKVRLAAVRVDGEKFIARFGQIQGQTWLR
jgi:hypothetical protein